jgi:NAD(P)H-nitrite reductase large subunit
MKVVIIGNGIAGSTAARYIRKFSDHEIIMISSEFEYPYSRTALMYIFMGHLQLENTKLYENDFWPKNKITLLSDHITSIDKVKKELKTSASTIIQYDKLIIATGSKPNRFNWPGEDLDGVLSLYRLQDLDILEEKSRSTINQATIIGGGLIGVELAEMLASRKIKTTFMVRERTFWDNVLPEEESIMIGNHIQKHGIKLLFETELHSINGEKKVNSVTTKSNQTFNTELVCITAGVSPNIQFLKESGLELNKGVLVNDFLQTSDEHIYAIGDCAEIKNPRPQRKAIEAVWYTGRMMGQVVAKNICQSNSECYDPGLWFNSAKFFDIEYQVYGNVPPNEMDRFTSILWQDNQLEKSIRIVYETSTKSVVGFNLLGIRYRHLVCEKWINEKTSIEEVLVNLSLANFDSEFFDQYEQLLVNAYNLKEGKALALKSKRSLNLVNYFLKKVNNA